MKLTSYIKYIFILTAAFVFNILAANATGKLPVVRPPLAAFSADTIPPQKQQPVDDKKGRPANSKGKVKEAPKVKEVPKARPQPIPKVVGPKVKPVKVIKPKVGPRL